MEVSSWYLMFLPVHAGPAEVLGGENGDSGPGEGGAAEQVGGERGAAEPAPGSTEPGDGGEEDTAGSVGPPAGTARPAGCSIQNVFFVCRQYQFVQQETDIIHNKHSKPLQLKRPF